MSSSKCARCELTVYPVEGLRCLDKIWHKGCFKCQECNMTLSLKNYKGFEKRPYCNAHCPQAKATTVADTPEIRRLAENTRIQSQAKYHEDFEKSKGKGFTAIADDPETLRIKNTSKIISNVAYHGELEKKKQMEEKRGLSGQEEQYSNNNNTNNNNNNNIKHQSRAQQHSDSEPYKPHHQVNNYPVQSQYPIQNQQQVQQQQQIHLHQQLQLQKQQQQQLHHNQQQQLLKQQHQQQLHYAQDHKNQPIVSRQHMDVQLQQQQNAKLLPSQYPIGHPHHQQQLIMRQQQQHQMMIQQQQRHSIDSSLAMPTKQQPLSNNHHHPQQIIKHQMVPAQPMKYMAPMGEPLGHQASPAHFIGNHMLSSSQLGGMANGQRVDPGSGMVVGSQAPQHLLHGHHQGVPQMNGAIPKQQHFVGAHQTRQMIHPGQIQQMTHHQMRPHSQQPIKQQQQQMPRGVFRAMYDYVANDVDEVSFFENDILIDCVNVDGNWLIGKVARSGQTGMLPANYVTEFSCQ